MMLEMQRTTIHLYPVLIWPEGWNIWEVSWTIFGEDGDVGIYLSLENPTGMHTLGEFSNATVLQLVTQSWSIVIRSQEVFEEGQGWEIDQGLGWHSQRCICKSWCKRQRYYSFEASNTTSLPTWDQLSTIELWEWDARGETAFPEIVDEPQRVAVNNPSTDRPQRMAARAGRARVKNKVNWLRNYQSEKATIEFLNWL